MHISGVDDFYIIREDLGGTSLIQTSHLFAPYLCGITMPRSKEIRFSEIRLQIPLSLGTDLKINQSDWFLEVF